MHKLV